MKFNPIDVFVCNFEQRDTFKEVVRHWAEIERLGHVRLHLMLPNDPEVRSAIRDLRKKFRVCVTDMVGKEFQRGRRIAAERYARSPIYVVTDDDCILDRWATDQVIPKAVEIMERSPEFGILCPLPSNAAIYRWTPEDYNPIFDMEVMEHHNVGGIRFTRKGVMPENYNFWADQPERQEGLEWKYDGPHCEQIRARGYRVGYFRHITFTHLGEKNPVVAEA